MKFLLLALVICAAAFVYAHDDDDQAWQEFKLQHNKLFLSKNKEGTRKKTFLKNRATVLELEAKAEAGEISYTPKMYAHADLSTEEFLSRFGGFVQAETRSPVEYTKFADVRTTVPASFDARTNNWISPVRNQGSCGSCWTFSTMACLEATLALRGWPNYDLSEQQLVDCAKGGRDGCQGGWMVSAFEYLNKVGGAMQEHQYPYTGVFGSCKYPVASGGVSVGVPFYPNPTADDIKAAIMKFGALAIACDASPWQFYGGGIFHGDLGNGANHAINVVGWGSENGQDYWIVRNSWGEDFGEDGYIRLAASADGGYHLTNTWGVQLGF